LALENAWGARKIHAELEKLGFRASLATVSRCLPKRLPGGPQRQSWRTFLQNHREGIAAMDLFTVSTARFRVLYVWFVLAHGRRRVIHFNVTANPTAEWVVQQLREAFPEASAPAYLVHDRDSIFSHPVREVICSFGTEPLRTAYRSPWQNGIAERWIGTCRRELLDHVIVLDERHLHRRLHEYVAYYNAERVHTRLRDAPHGRPLEPRSSPGAEVVGLPRVGGLHHRYVWREAA
jgi:transposase InsO family protein